MDDTDWTDLDEWFHVALAQRLLGPGCGSAEFEWPDWREQATWRMKMGYRPGLVDRYRRWQEGKRHG